MKLALDYFLLYHGINIEYDKPIEINSNHEDFIDIAALSLVCTRTNFDKFISLKSFTDLISHITDKIINNIDEMNHLQLSIVKALQDRNNHFDVETLHNSFNFLKKNKIINQTDFEKLISLFDADKIVSVTNCETINIPTDENIPEVDFEKSSYLENKQNVMEVVEGLKDLVGTEFYKELDESIEFLNNQKFSIGITGVMNAGKSTMLNALMGKEILGSAVVPETANLTIVKYDKNPSAKVFYWNKKEWDRIEKSSQNLKSMKEFVDETKKVFGDTLEDYILEDSRNDEVDIYDLASYTSADKSGKKCNIVKFVELKSDLEFLKDGIEIVDTPGLDDPVIQREEITKDYINQCDMMLHLMNVSQSATLKDVEFIIDALLYQNISKLLIVITRADTVTKEQLNEVIEYTKTSIERQLKSINKDSKLDFILEHIKFIPISGKMALYHRTGREDEALKAGFKIEDTGILDIEEYLMDSLFGKNSSKSKLILKSVKSKIVKTVEKSIKSLNFQLKLFSKSKDELKIELDEFRKKKAINESIFTAMREDIISYKKEAKEYVNSLETFLNSELIDLQNIIKQRVISDVRYTFEKTKKRSEDKRIKSIVETALKDGIIDVVRDYRYKFIKKSQTIGEICEQKYQEFGFSIGHKNDNFDARGFFQDDFKNGFLTSSNDVLVQKVIGEVDKSKPKNLDLLENTLQNHLREEFIPLEENIKEKAKIISEMLIENFFETLNAPLDAFEEKLKNDEKTLQEHLDSFDKNDKNKEIMTIDINNKIKKLENIIKGCK